MLARRARAAVARLEDDDCAVRCDALETLRQLKHRTLAQHACAVVARLEDRLWSNRCIAIKTLGKLEPARFAHYADALVARLKDDRGTVRREALAMLSHRLPRFVTLGIDFDSEPDLKSTCHVVHRRLLGRLAWYRCRLRFRAQRLVLYWYALPYRPNGPGHARDVEAWDRMTNGNRDQSASETPSTRKRQKRATGTQAVGGTS